jgi:DNA-binding NtrC family response regulator
MPRALLIDDDPDVLEPLALWVQREGFESTECASLSAARSILEEGAPDVVIADLELPDGRALELLPDLEARPDTQVVLITGHASVESAVEAFRHGVVDYLTKPVDTARLRQVLHNVLRTMDLRAEVQDLREELRQVGRFGRMVGSSGAMQELYDQVLRVAPTRAPVLVIGETGTGKELVAETVHQLSPRAKEPYVAVNCGAIAPTLIESELFGHEKGSFTGATARRPGLFERAHGGTLFLDEVTEMPLELQVKLLRVLETQEVYRIGGTEPIPSDVRVVAATNREPQRAVEEGRLREDLLYRLMVFPLRVPPLRDRGGDVALIAEHFLAQLNEQTGTRKGLTQDALDTLVKQPWPGNVRELRNCVERAFILASDRIDVEDLPFHEAAAVAGSDRAGVWCPVGTPIADVERDLILTTLEQYGGDKARTAKTLGISLRTLYNRLGKYGWTRRRRQPAH